MDFTTIPETNVIVNYSVPPLVIDNIIELCNNKGKKKYKISYTAFTNCIASIPDECVHDILVNYQPIYSMSEEFFTTYGPGFFTQTLTIHNVKYDDIKKQGYIPLMVYKKFEVKKNCKLFN
jgi:hypothetical protein